MSATSDAHRTLRERVPPGGTREADEILERFLAWVGDIGLEPYPQQEEAILELLADRHVVLSTPTGSGKSLVAVALHFKALCEGARSFYTAPVKALVSEKFFALCRRVRLRPNVGMITGDAGRQSAMHRSSAAPPKSSPTWALRDGEAETACRRTRSLDEFHYYADPAAWLQRGSSRCIELPRMLQFLLMSATLGNTDLVLPA